MAMPWREAWLEVDDRRILFDKGSVYRFDRSEEIRMKLYVGNLNYSVTDQELLTMFEAFGAVESAQVIMDRDTGRSKGFGFVEMKNNQEAQAAIAALNGQESGGRALTVNEARPRTDGGGGRGGSGGGGRGGYGGGRGGGGGGGRRY
jgi:RNA recognition motif-containing protein